MGLLDRANATWQTLCDADGMDECAADGALNAPRSSMRDP
jgi:hypothetical protein